METIFSATCAFLLAYKGDIASKIIASAAYDGLKKAVNLTSLTDRIKRFFNKESDAEKYVEAICTSQANNPLKPQRDIEDAYELITSEKVNDELFQEIKQWIEANESGLTQVSKMEFKNEQGINVGIQNAKNNIYNIQGDFKPKRNE